MFPRSVLGWFSSHNIFSKSKATRRSFRSVMSDNAHNAQAASSSSKLVVILAGPTAAGKSDVAARICASRSGIIVSADSVQAFRGVQIGANKPTPEELEETPHILVNVADHTESYNAAEWRRDALYTIQNLASLPANTKPNKASTLLMVEDEAKDQIEKKRQAGIGISIDQARKRKNYAADQPVLPVVVGGTMMYLQWLVHGKPDALRPSEEAVRKAVETMTDHESKDDFQGAVEHVGSFGPVFESQITKLYGKDWYRLRRILEMAYTVEEKNDDTLLAKLYSGLREGDLASLGYDVRCFFLCPDDRMNHTKIVDKRCEEMIRRGLLQETTDLVLSGSMPTMASKAIGYRQVLDYLEREGARDGNAGAFQKFLDQFTTATRQYAKKQMQWFRKDQEFVFVPVAVSKEDNADRVQMAADEVERMIGVSRADFDRERLFDTSTSAISRKNNEEQGKKMKTYQFKRHILINGSEELTQSLQKADECSNRLQAKRPRRTEQSLP